MKSHSHIVTDRKKYRGHVDKGFVGLAEQFVSMQKTRTSFGGAALVVYFQGEKVVDIYMGKKSLNEDWKADTLSMCYSTGKGVLATLVHILVSRGILAYDVPIAAYWPEFANNGKEKITLRHILSHQSGLLDLRTHLHDFSEIFDWQHMLDVVAHAKPSFNAGERQVYQPFAYGWLLGGVIEKATNLPFSEVLQLYLTAPLGLDGAFLNLPESEKKRMAYLFPDEQDNVGMVKTKWNTRKIKHKNAKVDRALKLSVQNLKDYQNLLIRHALHTSHEYDALEVKAYIPAISGIFTARSLAKMYAMLANKGVWQGQEFISPDVFTQATEIQYKQRDQVMPVPMHWRLGYHRLLTLGKKSNSGFGHIGFNGSGAWCDPERDLSFAYTHNYKISSMAGDYHLWGLTQEALRCADADLLGYKGWF